MASSSVQPTTSNRLLSALPPDVLAELSPHLRRVAMAVRQTVMSPGRPIEAVYFIESGWTSMVAHMEEGAQAEVGLIGNEGLAGASVAVGAETPFVEAYTQAAGTALHMETRAFQRALDNHPALRMRVLRYIEAMHAQSMQTAACNGRHGLEQRLSRWILMAHDRATSDELPLTQEFLALMLCVHRPSITLIARTLQQAGFIRYAQGKVIVTDCDGLEATACDCYRAVRDRFSQLLG